MLRAAVLEKICADRDEEPLSGIMRPILFFSENDSVSDIWKSMLEKKEHISVINDEYGCMRGIVTMEDVIETMLRWRLWMNAIRWRICRSWQERGIPVA